MSLVDQRLRCRSAKAVGAAGDENTCHRLVSLRGAAAPRLLVIAHVRDLLHAVLLLRWRRSGTVRRLLRRAMIDDLVFGDVTFGIATSKVARPLRRRCRRLRAGGIRLRILLRWLRWHGFSHRTRLLG